MCNVNLTLNSEADHFHGLWNMNSTIIFIFAKNKLAEAIVNIYFYASFYLSIFKSFIYLFFYFCVFIYLFFI